MARFIRWLTLSTSPLRPLNIHLHFTRVPSPTFLRALVRMWWKVAAAFHYYGASHHCSVWCGKFCLYSPQREKISLFCANCIHHQLKTFHLSEWEKHSLLLPTLKMARRCINQACPTPGAMQQMSGIVINSIIHTYCFPPLIRMNSAEANRPSSSEALWRFQREVKRTAPLSSRCR